MIVRIVKMIFQENEIEAFQKLFNQKNVKIRNVAGCQFLELYQDVDDPKIFFTYSYWENEEALENYRHSTLFREIWTATKAKFDGKPEAWSVNKLVSLT